MLEKFDPVDYPQYFEIAGDRIVYLKTGHGTRAKSYVWSDPEERVRAWYYVHLIEVLRYPVERIDLEVEVYRRRPEDFADIVVYADDAWTQPRSPLQVVPNRSTRLALTCAGFTTPRLNRLRWP